MHPAGFDTRAVASDDVTNFMSIANDSAETGNERLRDVLQANSFLRKMKFVKEVLTTWVNYGRLGGRPSTSNAAGAYGQQQNPGEMVWDGPQERPSGGGGKYVWVTVGAQGGDGEYICMATNPSQPPLPPQDQQRPAREMGGGGGRGRERS